MHPTMHHPMHHPMQHALSSGDCESSSEDMDSFPDVDVPWARSRMGSACSSNAPARPAKPLKAGQKIFNDVLSRIDTGATRLISDMHMVFEEREALLAKVVQESRFHAIEHYLSIEFERQREDLESVAATATLSLPDDQDIEEVSSWYGRAIHKYEAFFRRLRLIRFAFLRTFDFFRSVTETSLVRLQEKHAREVAAAYALHSMVQINVGAARTTTQHLDLAQMRERQSLEVSNIRQLNDLTSAREIRLLEFHLQSLEEVVQMDLKCWKETTLQRIAARAEIRAMTEKHRAVQKADAARETAMQEEEMHSLNRMLRRQAVAAEDDARMDDRDARRADFMNNGKSIANDALYKLTFAANDGDWASDSALGSDDDNAFSDEEDIDTAAAQPALPPVLALQRKHRRLNRARRKAAAKALEQKTVQLRTVLRAQRRHNAAASKRALDAIRLQHAQQHQRHTQDWIDTRRRIDEQHKQSLASLTQKHGLDRHVLLEADKQEMKHTRATSDLRAQQAMTRHVFHEVRNVLSSLLAIADSIPGASDPQLQELSVRQHTICEYAVETMNNMLDIYKYQGGTYVLAPVPLQLQHLVDRAADLQGDRIQAGVQLIRDGTPASALADEHVLTQLLVNLLSNAAKFTAEGLIRIVARALDPDTVEIGVCDTGPGMLAASQMVSTNEYLARNSGYGLYLAHLIAKALGSSLQTLSPVPADHPLRCTTSGGPGTYVSIRFRAVAAGQTAKEEGDMNPVGETTAAEAEPDSRSVPQQQWTFHPSGHLRVLVVDDQQFVRKHALYTLAKMVQAYPDCALDVMTAASAEGAARLLELHHYDLVLMDQHFDQVTILNSLPQELTQTQGGLPQELALSQELSRDLPHLCLSSTTDSGDAIRSFGTSELFDTQQNDGNAVGSTVIEQYMGPAICMIVTGSSLENVQKDFICIQKPYTHKCIAAALLQAHTAGLIANSVWEDKHCVRPAGRHDAAWFVHSSSSSG